jgi:hypothetical protein
LDGEGNFLDFTGHNTVFEEEDAIRFWRIVCKTSPPAVSTKRAISANVVNRRF